MVRDREAFRERFRQYKEGKSVVDIYDLPRYENGKFNESTKKKIDYYYNWLTHNGFDPISAVGILGNMMQESSLNPNSSNSLGYKGLLLNSKAIQQAIINQYNDHSEQSQLRYLSDWTDGATWIRKGPYAKDTALYSKSYLRKGYKTPEESAFEFLKRYERAIIVDPKTKKPVLDEHGNYTYQDKDKRLRYARQIYNYVTGAKSLEELIKELEQTQPLQIISKPDATRVYNVPTILQESVPSTWLQQATELPASTFVDAFERSKPLNLQRLVDLIEEYTPLYSKFKYEDGKVSQGNKLIPIDELHGWARSHNVDDPWHIRYTKNVTDDILNTLESFTNPYRNTINGRMSIDDAISIGLDAGAGVGAKAIRKAAKAIKPTKSSISLKGKTPRESALYFELNPDLISDADPIKVAEAADFIKNDALPRVLREAKKRGRSVDFDPNTITFKTADFKDSKLGGISTPNKIVYMRKNTPTDHYVHEMSHEMRRVTGETPEEASRLFSTYKNSEAFLKAHPEYALLLENEAVNTQLRYLISQANGGVKGKLLDSIIDNMPYDKFETYAILANAYTNDMARTGGLNRNTYKNTLKYVGATYPMLYAASLLKKHKNGKLPGYEDGEISMGAKRNLTEEELNTALLNVLHEQGMSGEDPLMSMLVGMKAVRLVGDLLSSRRLRQKAELYKRVREANDQTRNASRAWKMLDADRMARNWGYSDNPLGFLYDIFLDPIANMYTKILKHPILGPLIPFKDGKLPEYKNGKIYIKPANRGKFNATKKRTGKTTEELTHSKNPLTRKRAIFALNARKWKH